MTEQTSPNQIGAEDWAGEMGERWLANIDRFEGMIAPAGAGLMAHAGFSGGERVIDIGCGAGGTTIEIGERVGSGGSALGVDISSVLIAEAERRARAADADNVRFLAADATTAKPEGSPFDRMFSRFGSMFFEQPAAALANLRSMLRAGGRADLGVWAPPRENLWVAGLVGTLRRFIELPEQPPHAPGPFAFDDPDYVRPLLEGAGFERISFTTWRGEQLVGGAGSNGASAADFALNALSFGRAMEDQSPQLRAEVLAALTEMFAAHETPHGVRMPATAWLITAYA
jgi:SAM-dependent methyltransferase